MRHEPVSHKELDDVIEGSRYAPDLIRVYATKAELVEQEKDHRDIPQTTLAAIFGVEPRNLFKWTELFRAYGIEGLMSHGGRGRKPKLSYEEMDRVIKKGQEGGGFQSSPEDEAGVAARAGKRRRPRGPRRRARKGRHAGRRRSRRPRAGAPGTSASA